MNPFGGLDYFLLLLLVLLPVVICGLKGKQLRVCGMLVCAVMLLAIFRTLHALLLLAAFWVWQTALTFWYLYLRKRAKKAWVFHLAVALSLLPLLLVKLSLWVEPLRALSMLGLSYLSFRAVQPLIDIYDGRITELNLLDLSYFVLFSHPCPPARWTGTGGLRPIFTKCAQGRNTARCCGTACGG